MIPENGSPSKGSTYLDLVNGDTVLKTYEGKGKQFIAYIKHVFETKIKPKDKDLEREVANFLILNLQNYTALKVFHHEVFISLNEIDKIIANFDNKKAPGINQITENLLNV